VNSPEGLRERAMIRPVGIISIITGAMRTSQNSVKAKFAGSSFRELRICRSEPHTNRDRKRNATTFEPSVGSDTPLTMPPNNPRFPCRSLPRFPRLFNAALNAFAAERQTLVYPRDLTEQTTAQTGFYTHRGLDKQASSIGPPP
jgi:hypothetical protein